MDAWFLTTTTDAAGNVIASFESASREKDTVTVEDGEVTTTPGLC